MPKSKSTSKSNTNSPAYKEKISTRATISTRAPCWKYFEHRNDHFSAICKICLKSKTELESKINRCDNTKALLTHLEKSHPKEFSEVNQKTNLIEIAKKDLQTLLTVDPLSHLVENQHGRPSDELITRAIANMIFIDLQPYSFVEDPAFNSFVKLAFPKYTMPGRKFFTNYVEKLAEEARRLVKLILENTDDVHFTTDGWSANDNTSFITVTCHFTTSDGELEDFVLDTHALGNVSHTGENLGRYLQATMDRWDIQIKTDLAVVDNAPNIVDGVKQAEIDCVRCVAHTIQLCAKDVLESDSRVVELLKKCRSIVGHFKKSTKSSEALKNIQSELKMQPLKLIQEVIIFDFSLFFFLF